MGMPDDVNATTSANEASPAQRYQPTSYVNQFCDAVGHVFSGLQEDFRNMDSAYTSTWDRAKGVFSAGIAGPSDGMKRATLATLQMVGPMFEHPIDTTKAIFNGLPDGLKAMRNEAADGAQKIREGRTIEGTFLLTRALADIIPITLGAAALAKGATTALSKGATFYVREMETAAAAVREGMEGGGGSLALATGGVYMAEDAAASVRAATMSMPGPGFFLGGPLLMSAAHDATTSMSGATSSSNAAVVTLEKTLSAELAEQLKLTPDAAGNYVISDGMGGTTTVRLGDTVLLSRDSMIRYSVTSMPSTPKTPPMSSAVEGLSRESRVTFPYSRDFGERIGLRLNAEGQHFLVDDAGQTYVLNVGDQVVAVMDDSGRITKLLLERNPLGRSLDAAARQHASTLHNDWRTSRSAVEGTAADGLPMREPRWKQVEASDPLLAKIPEQFKRTVDGRTEVDIANLDFDRLPAKFQAENATAAQGATQIIEMHIGDGGPVYIDINAASAQVHTQWLDRNGSWAPPEQCVPYRDLSPIEQAKDQVVVSASVDAAAAQMSVDGHFVSLNLQSEVDAACAAAKTFTTLAEVTAYLEALLKTAVSADTYISQLAKIRGLGISLDGVTIKPVAANMISIESGGKSYTLVPRTMTWKGKTEAFWEVLK